MELRPRWDRTTPAAIATLLGGFGLGAAGFFRYLPKVASDNNTLMLELARRQAEGTMPGDVTGAASVALTSLSLLTFVVATPLGWLSTYLVVTGLVRCVAASVREPRGDPLIGLATRLWTRRTARRAATRALTAREALEGPEVMDRLATAARFGVEGAELVVVASRRKPEWTPGTILDCGDRHFEVGPAVERTLGGGLRTLYPLKEAPGAGVFRRVVRYDLPALQPDPTRGGRAGGGGRVAIFTETQKAQLRERGIPEEEASRQLALLASPVGYVELVRPCRIGDGIETVAEDRQESLILLHDQAAAQGRCAKLVPASGAATRMFQDLLNGRGVDTLLEAVDRFAFADALRAELAFRGYDLDVLKGAGSGPEVVDALLGADGLGYQTIPKGLIPFHKYDGGSRTAFEEHLAEAAATVKDSQGVCRVHFTVSPEHLQVFRLLADRVAPAYEQRLGVKFAFGWSVQKASTDTIAAAPEGGPFVSDDGTLVLRPAGHGALLENLADLGGDIVFVKNIDNVQPDALRGDTVRWKRILGGRLVELQRTIFLHVARLRGEPINAEFVRAAAEFVAEALGLAVPTADTPLHTRRDALLRSLERPLRVCGVVRNTGEPGGGPFWIKTRDGRIIRQIVEGAQVDPASEAQRTILHEATHFNPVDLVCGVRDVEGRPFDLRSFVDPRAIIVTRKSHQGRELLAFERPGLWNGAMAGWLTVFVEVPISTFTPVKTVIDLLRPEHQTG